MLSRNLLDTMVSTTSSRAVKVFASTNLANDVMNLFLLNKSTENTPVNLSLKGFSATSATRSVYQDSRNTYQAPSYKAAKNLVVNDKGLSLSLSLSLPASRSL